MDCSVEWSPEATEDLGAIAEYIARDSELIIILVVNEVSISQHSAQFDEVLEPFGGNAANFFLAASLYHAHKVSYEAACRLAGLGFEKFRQRLREHFNTGYIIADETVLDDMRAAEKLAHR